MGVQNDGRRVTIKWGKRGRNYELEGSLVYRSLKAKAGSL